VGKPWDTVEVQMHVLRVNAGRSVMIRTLDGKRSVWLPAQYLIYYEDDFAMQMPRWLAEKEGFTLYERDYVGPWSKMSNVRRTGGGILPPGGAAPAGSEVARQAPEDQGV
jgi:hypothetical protein